ncbi:MAG: RNA polymerase sigma factor [Candidatus Dormibacteraceae bacterium]
MSAELIGAARGGDRHAFEALIRPLIDPAYRMAFAMLSNREEAEDAVQEGALKAWRAARRLRSDTSSLRPWFLAIVANECRGTRRRRWRSVLKLADVPGFGSGTDGDLAGRLDLRHAIDRLPRDQRLLLHLFFCLDLPFEEVARTLGISPAAAKSRLYRITRRLRPGLDPSTEGYL